VGVNRLIMRNFFTPILPADGGAVPARNVGGATRQRAMARECVPRASCTLTRSHPHKLRPCSALQRALPPSRGKEFL